jgi:photosystem II stability/assembly factor-like uncharacterized protein
MNKNLLQIFLGTLLFTLCFSALFWQCQQKDGVVQSITGTQRTEEESEEKDKYDGPAEAAELEFMKTRNPYTNEVSSMKLWEAIQLTERAKMSLEVRSSTLTWTERGPNSDGVGSSNGNTRPGTPTPATAGRIRATWVDLNDNTKKTLWVGGVCGGLWKTDNITATTPTWTLINDRLSNMAITGICQNPSNPQIMYVCTGEAYFNGGAVQGIGVFKSTDGGANWAHLSSTSAYTYCTKILCDNAGNVYLGTQNDLYRSLDGGATWADLVPSGVSTRVSDIEISSTGRLHVALGYRVTSGGSYLYTDNPTTVTTSTWTSPTTPFTYPLGNLSRCDLAVSKDGNTVYAALSNATGQVDKIAKSTNGGAVWSTISLSTTDNQNLNGTNTQSQGWYCLALAVDSSDANNVIVGNLNAIKSTDGGANWTKVSEWVGTSGQYVHADIHSINWYDNGNKLVFACDGGIHFSSDGGTTIGHRNTNLRLKQFYSGVLHPTTTNYILGGAQDNGNHVLTGAGLSSSTEVMGGDGAFTAIDKDQPTFQFGAYTYNQYRFTRNGGTTWQSEDFSGNQGLFINPFGYDDTGNRLYASHEAGKYLRWNDPQTGNSADIVAIADFNSKQVSAVKVSPYTANTVYFGTNGATNPAAQGRIVKVANAHAATPTATNITDASMPVGYVSCVNVGTSDQNLIACFSNYGIENIWVSTNGGTSWTGIDGNLPDMPVRWVMFHPTDNTKAYIATETGVWETAAINGASTSWTANTTFPNVRTDMLFFRSSDNLLLAATHGRGMWTATVPNVLSVELVDFAATDKGNFVSLNWKTAQEFNNKGFDIEKSTDGKTFKKIGFVAGNGTAQKTHYYAFDDKSAMGEIQYYRLKQLDSDGSFAYSKTVLIASKQLNLDIVSINNPFSSDIQVWFSQSVTKPYKLELFDLSGHLVYASPKTTGASNQISFNVPQLNSGVYVAKIYVGYQQFTKKIMKL